MQVIKNSFPALSVLGEYMEDFKYTFIFSNIESTKISYDNQQIIDFLAKYEDTMNIDYTKELKLYI